MKVLRVFTLAYLVLFTPAIAYHSLVHQRKRLVLRAAYGPVKRADAAEARSALGTGPQFILELAWT